MNSEPLQRAGYSPLCRVKSKMQQSAGPPAPHTARARECRRRAGKGTPGRAAVPPSHSRPLDGETKHGQAQKMKPEQSRTKSSEGARLGPRSGQAGASGRARGKAARPPDLVPQQRTSWDPSLCVPPATGDNRESERTSLRTATQPRQQGADPRDTPRREAHPFLGTSRNRQHAAPQGVPSGAPVTPGERDSGVRTHGTRKRGLSRLANARESQGTVLCSLSRPGSRHTRRRDFP